MDGRTNLARIGIYSAAVASLAGAAVAWFARQLLHLHDPGLSDHRR